MNKTPIDFPDVKKKTRDAVMRKLKEAGDSLKIVEGIESVWYYHLSETGDNCKPALCGNRRVMRTSIPLKTWGMRSHIGEKYCSECEKAANSLL